MKRGILISIFLMGIISCNQSSSGKSKAKLPKDDILSAAELPANILDHPDNFFTKNAQYNPNIFAKFTANMQQAASLESQLRSKNLLKLRWESPPIEVSSWWNPAKDSLNFIYMTTINAPVHVIISPGNENKQVYIWISSP